MHRRFPVLLTAVLCAALCGCSDSKTASVSGTVKLDGKPLPNAAVSFQPMGEKLNPGPGSFAQTNGQGQYTLQIIGGGAGVAIGKHKVEIRCPIGDVKPPVDDDAPRNFRDQVPPKYNLNSMLTFEVKPGNNTADFDLKTK